MWRFLVFGYRWSYAVFAVTILLTALAVYFARNVRFDVSTDSLINPDSPLLREYEETRDRFGSDQMAAVYAADEELFTRERLLELSELNEKLMALPFVQSVESLFTLPDIRDVDGILETAPLLHRIPEEPEALSRKLRQAVENPLLLGNVISEDGTDTLITVYIRPSALDETGNREIYERIQQLVEPYVESFEELYQVGGPAIETWLTDYIRYDQIRILPLAALVLVILMILNLRNIALGLLPTVNAAIATFWTLGVMAALQIPVNFLNYIVPVLILVIGSTEDVHILHEYQENLKKSGDGSKAMQKTGEELFLALLLTALTTFLGFAATSISDLPILREFGSAAVIGMTARFIVTVLFLPACLRLLGRRLVLGAEKEGRKSRYPETLSRAIVHRIVPRILIVVGLVIAFMAISTALSTRIKLSNDLVSFLNPESHVVRKLNRVAERLSGTKLIYLTLHGTTDSFRQPAELKRLAAITDYLRSLEKLDSAISFADVVSRINEQLREGDPAFFTIPDTSAAVTQLLLFAHPKDFESYVSVDYAETNIVIRCHINDSTEFNNVMSAVRAELNSGRFGILKYTLTGRSVLTASAVESITKAQILSLGSMTLVLFVIVSALFLSFRCGALTLVANLFSIFMIFGFMGLFGVSLNVGTCMVAAITLGLAIDDTLHILVRFNRELKSLKDERKGIEAALKAELKPILVTSISLAGGFSILAFSSFGPVQQFGYLSAGVVLIALAGDLIITPVFFAKTRIVTLWDILELNIRRALLESSPFFKGLTKWQAKKVILASNVEEFKKGETVIRRGDMGNKMYVIIAGELEVTFTEGSNRVQLATLRLGEVFGEVALVSQIRRTADITALSDSRLLALDAPSLLSLRRFSPYLASHLFLNIARILGERFAEKTERTAAPFKVAAAKEKGEGKV